MDISNNESHVPKRHLEQIFSNHESITPATMIKPAPLAFLAGHLAATQPKSSVEVES